MKNNSTLSLPMVGRFVIYGDGLHLFGGTEPKIITSLDELAVVPISEAASDGSYPLGRFVLTDSAYARWQSIIKHALKHKTLISKGVFR